MGSIRGAARRTDWINHAPQVSEATTKIVKAGVDAATTLYTVYRIAKVGAVFVPGAGWTALAVSFAVEWAVSAAIKGVVKYVVDKKYSGEPEIASGSPNVFVNKLEAARGEEEDDVACKSHGKKKVKTGAMWVSVNQKPFARLKDLTTCPANIDKASDNVAIGGPSTYYNPHKTLERVLWLFSLSSKMKLAAVKAVVDKKSVGKAIGKALGDAAKKRAQKEITDPIKQSAKEWGQDQGYLPW